MEIVVKNIEEKSSFCESILCHPDKGTEKALLVGMYKIEVLSYLYQNGKTANWLESVSAVVFSVFVDNDSVIRRVHKKIDVFLNLIRCVCK